MPTFKPRDTRILETRALIAGLRKRLSPKAVVHAAGEDHTPADLVKLLEEHIALEQAIEHAHAVWTTALAEEERFRTKHKETLSLLRRWIHLTYDGDPVALADFGLEPRKKPRVLTVEEKKLVAEKIRATRAARHTMGPKQRAAIKGEPPPPPPPAEDAAAEE